ncbi:MAG: ATP-binding protein [Streptomyces sp.]|nr:ATP-binding protein [Streptomyces sp.]
MYRCAVSGGLSAARTVEGAGLYGAEECAEGGGGCGARLDCLVDTAELLVSELTTNALRNTTTDSYVSMDWQPKPPDFRVTVWDSGAALPQPVRAEADDEGGRGLALVESCSDDWGVVDYTGKDAGVTGKAVWFALAPPKPAE